jgi:hypothetical protein
MTRKRRHRGARTRSGAKPAPSAQGFDYGAGFGVLLVGDMEFPRLLTKAGILGVGYGQGHDAGMDTELPLVSLIASSPGPLVEAFDRFAKWARATDGDALEVCWVFLRDGGYLIGLTVEAQGLQYRCTGFARHTVVRVATVPVWVKRMDTCGEETLRFRKYRQILGTPFLFAGAHCSLRSGDLQGATSGDIRPIPGIQPLRKVNATLVDEADIAPDTLPWVALQTATRGSGASASPPARTSTWSKDRGTVLRAHFPVTLERARILQSESSELAALCGKYTPWQVEQAICNVVLSAELFDGLPHYPGVQVERLPDLIGGALAGRFEQADGQRDRLRGISVATVECQIDLDSTFLLAKAGHPTPSTATDHQGLLLGLGLLDPRASVAA